MGQDIYAKIKRSSKYYGQGERGALFQVRIVGPSETYDNYLAIGGPGGRYRLADVNLFVIDMAGKEVRIS